MSYTKAAGIRAGSASAVGRRQTVSGTLDNKIKQAQERADLLARFKAKVRGEDNDDDTS